MCVWLEFIMRYTNTVHLYVDTEYKQQISISFSGYDFFLFFFLFLTASLSYQFGLLV